MDGARKLTCTAQSVPGRHIVNRDLSPNLRREPSLTVVGKHAPNQTYENRQRHCWPVASVVELRPNLGRGGLLRTHLPVVSAIRAP